MGGVSQRKAPALAIFQEDVDVLSREKLQAFVGGELQGNDHHVWCRPLKFLDAARKCFDLDIFYRSDLAAFNYQVAQWHRAAEQRHAGLFFYFRQCAFAIAAEINRSLYDFALARPACAIAAPVREGKTFAKRGLQDSFVGFGEENISAWLNSDLIRHGLRMHGQINRWR